MQGTQIDYFGLVAITGNNLLLELKSSSLNPSQDEATASNRRGDVIAKNVYNQRSDPQCVYSVIGTYVLSALSLGKMYTFNSVNYILTEVSVATANGSELPQLTLKGMQVPSTYDDSVAYAKLPLPAISIAGSFAAQNLAFTTAPISETSGDMTKSDWSATAQVAYAKDHAGVMLAASIYGTKYEQKVDYVLTIIANAAPTVTAPTGYFVSSLPTMDESQTDYASGSFAITSFGVRAA